MASAVGAQPGASRLANATAVAAGPTTTSIWILPNLLVIGAYPWTETKRLRAGETSQGKLNELYKAGARVFVCLQTISELERFEPLAQKGHAAVVPPYRDMLPKDCTFVHLPIEDRKAPTRDVAKEYVGRLTKIIEAAREAKQVVYMHCWGGGGRSFTMLGAYLLQNGGHEDIVTWLQTTVKNARVVPLKYGLTTAQVRFLTHNVGGERPTQWAGQLPNEKKRKVEEDEDPNPSLTKRGRSQAV